MSVDYDAVRQGMAAAVPFAAHLGLDIAQISDGEATVVLPDDAALRNHVGSQHAGALFTAGEAASGAAFVGAFIEQMAQLRPLASEAQIKYTKIASGQITARAKLARPAQELRDELDAEGVIRFPVEVALSDRDGAAVAEMTVHWHVKKTA